MALTTAAAAKPAAQAAVKVLTTDLVTIRGRVYRVLVVGKGETKREFLEPVDYEVHVNPVTVGVGALAVGAGLVGLSLAAWWAGLGVKLDPEVQGRIRDIEASIANGEARVAELERLLVFTYGSVQAAPPGDPLMVERVNILAQVKELRKERRRQQFRILDLEARPRFGENLFRIF